MMAATSQRSLGIPRATSSASSRIRSRTSVSGIGGRGAFTASNLPGSRTSTSGVSTAVAGPGLTRDNPRTTTPQTSRSSTPTMLGAGESEEQAREQVTMHTLHSVCRSTANTIRTFGDQLRRIQEQQTSLSDAVKELNTDEAIYQSFICY